MSLIWGVPYLLIKVADGGVSVPVLVFARVAGGAVVLLPIAVHRGQLGVLVDAAKDGGTDERFLACTLFQAGGNPVYVHAKIGIVDDRWLTLGSANLNEHSLFNDTEVNLVTDDAALARRVRERLWSEHLGDDCTDRDPLTVLEELWRPALHPSARHDRPLRALPSVSRRSSRLMGPLKGLLVDG